MSAKDVVITVQDLHRRGDTGGMRYLVRVFNPIIDRYNTQSFDSKREGMTWGRAQQRVIIEGLRKSTEDLLAWVQEHPDCTLTLRASPWGMWMGVRKPKVYQGHAVRRTRDCTESMLEQLNGALAVLEADGPPHGELRAEQSVERAEEKVPEPQPEPASPLAEPSRPAKPQDPRSSDAPAAEAEGNPSAGATEPEPPPSPSKKEIDPWAS